MTKVQATYNHIWKIAYPIMLASIAQTVLNVTDTAFLARVGETELGASAISGVFYFVLVMISVAIAIGLQILIARKSGEGDKSSIGMVFDNGLLILLIFSVIMFLIAEFAAPYLYVYVIREPDIRQAGITFIQYRAYGLLVTIPALALRAFFTGISKTRMLTLQSVVTAILNVVLDYVLIFGHWGFDAMGIKGAGIATASAEIIGGLLVFFYSFYFKEIKHFELFRFKTISTETIKRIFNLSSPIILQNFLSMGAWFLFFVFIEKLGKHELAISNVIRASYMLLMTPVWGFSSTTNSMVSNLIGQKKYGDVFVVVKKIIVLSLLVIGSITALFALFPHVVLSLTAADEKLISDSMESFYIICCSTLIFSVSMNLLSAVSGTGATRAAMFIEILNIFIYMVYIYLCCLVFKTSIEVVWKSELLYWGVMGICAYWYLKKGSWRKISI